VSTRYSCWLGLAQLHVDEVVDGRHALAALLLQLLAFGGLARDRALYDQSQLGLGHLVVAVGVVLIELGMDQRLRLGTIDETVAVGIECLELGPRTAAAVLDIRPAGHVL
jgi:hypothetical protein